MDATQYFYRRAKCSIVSKAKNVGGLCLRICNCSWPVDKVHLAIEPQAKDSVSSRDLHQAFDQLAPRAQERVYFWRWALAVEGGAAADERDSAADWGARHLWEDLRQAARAVHRSGGLGSGGLIEVDCRQFVRGRQWRYFTLPDRAHRNPTMGWIGFINGPGVSLEEAKANAERFSGMYVDGNNLHCVYNPSSQSRPGGGGCLNFILQDSGRYMAMDAGLQSEVAVLVAQQWIDFLDDHPGQFFLQCCHSGGATEVAAAVRLLQRHRPELLERLRVISLCGAHIITPPKTGGSAPGMEVKNILKVEDRKIFPWATGAGNVYTGSPSIVVVPHSTGDDPHSLFSTDYLLARQYVLQFMRSGHLGDD